MSDAAIAAEAAYPRRAYAWTVVGILFCTAVLSYTDRQVLSLLVILGYGGGMLAGGYLADRAAAWRGRRGKIELCGLAALAILPLSALLNAPSEATVMIATPVYFALSAVVTVAGLSAILDASPNRVRGLAMAISFFLNIAIGAGLGPTVVAAAGEQLFGAAAGLGPAIAFTVAVSYAIAGGALLLGLKTAEPR